VDGGPVRLGHSSTVVRLEGRHLHVLRRGGLSEESIRAILRQAGQGT
jgi:tRNA A37 threonylcarbamoyladenosine synthetase subunit TsaC/SUA5/YrdC